MTMRNGAFCVLTALVVLAARTAPAFAQEDGTLPSDRVTEGNLITIGRTVTLPSEVFGGDRQALVYLPDDYSTSKERYPVVYLLDGAFFFLPTAGIVDFYSSINRMPRMMVVAIVQPDRMHELSTAPSGGSARLSRFLREELIPYIDGHFRTEPFRVLVGHSLGGLFTVHSLLESPDLFQAHIAASPALFWDGGSEHDRAREVLTSAPSLRNFLYLTYSGGDGENIRTSTDALRSLLADSAPAGLDWQFAFLPNDRHNSSPVPSVLGGLNHLFSAWAYRGAETAAALREHYQRLSETFGFECRPNVGSVAAMGRSLIRKGDVAEAVRVFEYNARVHPEAAEAHVALGSAYRTAGNVGMAIASYERALRLRPEDAAISKILRELGEGGA